MRRPTLADFKGIFLLFALESVTAGELFAETVAPSAPPASATTVVAPSIEVVVESAMCELRAAQDGSLEEYVNRDRAMKLEEGLRDRGLLGNALGDAFVDKARRMSGCELPAIGETICQTLENHRNSRIDPDCRRILSFDGDRFDAKRFQVPVGQSPYSWALVTIIAVQKEQVYPGLKDKEVTRNVDPRLTNVFLEEILVGVVSGLIVEVVKEGVDAAVEREKAHAEWSRQAENIIRANGADSDSIRLSRERINGLEELRSERAAETLSGIETVNRQELSGTLSKEEAASARNELIRKEEMYRSAIDKSIAELEGSIVESAKSVEERSDSFLKDRSADLENACEQLDCPEYEIDLGARKSFEEDVAFCKARYALDPTIEAMPVGVVPSDDAPRNPALGPKCNIETFERILSGYSERTQTLTDAFGEMGRQADGEARAFEEQRDAEDGYEDALAAHKNACQNGVDTCDCVKAEERLDRATERLYPVERLPSDIAREYLGRNREFGTPFDGSDDAESWPRDLGDFSLCKPGARLIAIEDENGVIAIKFVKPGDPDYPKTSPIFFCNPLFAPFLSRFEVTSMALGSAAPPAYSQDQIDAMIAQAKPIGGDLIEAQRRQWRLDDSCEDEGRPFPNGRSLLPITPLPGLPLTR